MSYSRQRIEQEGKQRNHEPNPAGDPLYEIEIIAPEGFVQAAISENLFAGNAMTRRKSYTYADLVPCHPCGHVDMAIGKAVASGDVGILPPTRSIVQPIEELVIDGVRMVFQNTPGTEAPAEMNTWFPDFKTFWAAENMVGSLHNALTLRGAQVRDTSIWSKYINEAIYRFADHADVMFASHNWPRWGKDRILEVMRDQRDMYAHLNNQVLHHANCGVTINQIHNVYEPPKGLQKKWYTRGYHGSYEHNSRAVMQRYLGYWDLNPATLVPLSPEDSAPLYTEMMGGAEKIIAKGRELYAQGKNKHAVEILDKLVHAVELSNATLTTIAGYQAPDADLTLTIDRRDLEDLMIGAATFPEKVAAGKATLEGNPQVLAQLASTMVKFDPWFEVLPGTKEQASEEPKAELFEDDAPVEPRP